MFINTWVDKNYNNLRKVLSVIKSPEWEDIFHEVIIQFLEMESGKTYQLIKNGDADRYIMGMFKTNVKSKTGPYYRMYHRDKSRIDEELYIDTYIQKEEFNDNKYCIADIGEIINTLDVFFIDKLLYKEYLDKKIETPSFSINKISGDAQVPKGTLTLQFSRMRRQIKINVKKIIQEDEENRNG